MSLYEIIKALQKASGNINKQAVLDSNKDNTLLKSYLKATYDPAISYYIKKAPTVQMLNYKTGNLGLDEIKAVQEVVAQRKLTGGAASHWLLSMMSGLTQQDMELLTLLINRSVGAGIGDTMILKTFPELWFSVPYQRCSLMDKKAKDKFSKLDTFYVQLKCDGSFAYAVKESGQPAKVVTRSGSVYPQWFADKLTEGLEDGCVLAGELEVYPHFYAPYAPCSRQCGNGILNSILKGAEPEEYNFYDFILTAWDCFSIEDFKANKTPVPYYKRLTSLEHLVANCSEINAIKTTEVSSLEEAYSIYSKFTSEGKEGAVIKTTDFLWKDGTSKDIIKLKVEFEIDLVITAINEGAGKAAGMMGSVSVASSEGIIQVDVGTGWSDEQRAAIWFLQPIGGILTVKANDIIGNRNIPNKKSLFLPVAIELREDKKVADSYEHCVAQLNAAKGIL